MKALLLKFYPEIAGLGIFILYLNTMCPTIMGQDSGELATVQATLSIPHPTGYPLFAILGYIFLKLPLPFETIIRLNILASLWCAFTVIIMIRTSKLLVENFPELSTGKFVIALHNAKNAKLIIALASIFPGLMLGFSLTFWLQSTHVEVHSLQIFLISLVIFLSIKSYITKETVNLANVKKLYRNSWVWIFIIIGLGFANHLTIIYLIPSTILLYFIIHNSNKVSIRNIVLLFFISFFVAAVFYIWMMYRASSNPPFKYGDPSSIAGLYDHITAKRYSTKMFSSTSSLKYQIYKFINFFQISPSESKWGEFSFSLVLGVTGLVFISFLSKRFFLYMLLIIVTSLMITLNYHIIDINEYYLSFFYILCLSSSFSIANTWSILPQNRITDICVILLLSTIITIQVYGNYELVDKSDNRKYEQFAKDYIETLPENAVLYTDDWDNMLSPALYLQNILKVRRDVIIFSPWRRICFTPYQSTNIKQFFENDELIKNENTFIYGSINERDVELSY